MWKDTQLSRRRFLGGAAATVGLPFLPSAFFAPRRARAQGCPPAPKRFLAWYKPNGLNMPDWTPRETGKAWTPTLLTEPLAPVRNKMLILSGLDNQRVARPALPPGNHGGGTGCFLTQVRVNANYDDPNRTSLDQVLADHLGSCTKLPSVQLGIETSSSTGTCDGAPCQFSRSIAWRRNTPLPNVVNPQVAFDRLFQGFDRTLSDADAARRRVLRTSVLDHVAQEAKALSAVLNAVDQRKLDEYLTGVRELEGRIQKLAPGGGARCAVPTRPPESMPFPQHVDTMIELMALAFQCDVTRVATFMIGNAGSNRDYAFIGAPGGYHGSSHHQGRAENIDKLKKIGRWNVEQLAKLAARLDRMTDVDGKTVLDNTCIFFSSEISDGDRHNHWDKPVCLIGGLGGAIRADGRHVAYVRYSFPRSYIGPQGGPPVANLFVSILRGFGHPATRFGENGTAPLPDVLA